MNARIDGKANSTRSSWPLPMSWLKVMLCGFPFYKAPPAYSELTPNHAVSSTGDPDDNDDQLIKETNYCPLYTYVSDYIAPPPYSEFETDYNRASNLS